MKERGILFGSSMVRALLAGAKTQTRRIYKPRYPSPYETVEDGIPYQCDDSGIYRVRTEPYGLPGDRLWCREAWRTAACMDKDNAAKIVELAKEAGYTDAWAPIEYSADGQRRDWEASWYGAGRQRLARFMPRWASRITLEVTEVRVQRLRSISEEDARAEGVEADKTPGLAPIRATSVYAELWDSINGAGSWASNPFVWAISFRRIVDAR